MWPMSTEVMADLHSLTYLLCDLSQEGSYLTFLFQSSCIHKVSYPLKGQLLSPNHCNQNVLPGLVSELCIPAEAANRTLSFLVYSEEEE